MLYSAYFMDDTSFPSFMKREVDMCREVYVIDIFVSSTGNLNIDTLDHMEKLSTMRSLETPVI